MSGAVACGTRLAFGRAVAAAARGFGLSERDVLERRNGWPRGNVAVARRTAIYLAVVAHDAGVRSVARAAGLSPEGVRKALASIEERRDDPAFDRMIERMEIEVAA